MTAVVVNAVAGSERFADRDGGLCIAEAIGAGEDLEEHAVETDDVVFSDDSLVLEAEFSVCLGSGKQPCGKQRLGEDAGRSCEGRNKSGEPCRQPPIHEYPFCFWHSPDHADLAAEARRLGGQRRKREGTVAGAFEFEGLTSIVQLRRLLEIAAFDALGLKNSIARVRALGALVQAGTRLLEAGETEDRLAAIEAVLGPRLKKSGGQR